MAEDKKEGKKFEDLDNANKGYNELYGAFQKGQEEGKLNKKELETLRTENATLKGGAEERTRRESELRTRIRNPMLTPEQKRGLNEQFLEQMRADPTATFDNRFRNLIQSQGYVKRSEIDKENDASAAKEQAFNDFTSQHEDFEEVRPAFLKRWNKLAPDQRNAKSLELAFAAAKGDMALMNPVDLKAEKEKMRKELIKEMRDKAALAGGRKIRTQKEMDEDEKQVSDIINAHKKTKANIV